MCLVRRACGPGGICWLCSLLRARRLRAFLEGLPDAAPDGTWLVVAYEWGDRVQSGRVPMEKITSISELRDAVVEYGAEAVDAEIRVDNTDFFYMDLQGVERRVSHAARLESSSVLM